MPVSLDSGPTNVDGTADDVIDLRAKSHAIPSTAIPFPGSIGARTILATTWLRSWITASPTVCSTGISIIIKSKPKPSFFTTDLHPIALAAVPPLLKVGFAGSLLGPWGVYCDRFNSRAGELSVFLVGAAGVIKLWGSNGWPSTEWASSRRRYASMRR